VTVTFSNGNTYTADALGKDSKNDIAVLKINWSASTMQQQQQPPEPLVIGNSSELQVGEQVIAIGYPFLDEQSFSNLLTSGVVSKVGVEVRAFEDEEGEEEDEPPILNAIITDAAIADANSGGSLLNMQVQVIGINTASDEDNSLLYICHSF
jgi:putative serine protease PepD